MCAHSFMFKGANGDVERTVERDGNNYKLDLSLCADYGIKTIKMLHQWMGLPSNYAKF